MAASQGFADSYTALDRAVMQAVYGSGLSAGASRAQFRAARLIR